MSELDRKIETAAHRLASARKITIFSGAGMSAESGIPTFRDPMFGIWKNKFRMYLFGTPLGWNWIPGFAWSSFRIFYDPIAAAQPNPGHIAIAQIPERLGADVLVATQNVDSLHQRAGTPADRVFEVHGSVYRFRCIKNGHPMEVPRDPFPDSSPECPVCGSKARPDAVLFSENLDDGVWRSAVGAMRRLGQGDVLIIIGTSGVVYPAADLPRYAGNGAFLIEINPSRSELSGMVDLFIGAPGSCLERIVYRAQEIQRGITEERGRDESDNGNGRDNKSNYEHGCEDRECGSSESFDAKGML